MSDNTNSIQKILESRNIEPTQENVQKFEKNLSIISREQEAELDYSRMNEKVTALPVGEKSFIEDTLLVGVFFNNQLHKDIKVDRPDGITVSQFFQEKARTNPFLALESILMRSIRSIGAFSRDNTKDSTWKSIINKLTIADADYITLLMSIAGKRDSVENEIECINRRCGIKFEISISPTDLIPYEAEEGAIVFENTDPYMYFTSEEYTAKIKLPQLRDSIDIFRNEEEASSNPILYNYFIWSKCVKQINGQNLDISGNDINFFANLEDDFLDWFTEEWESCLPKIDSKIETRCIKCDSQVFSAFSPIFFLFRKQKKSEDLKKNIKKKKTKLRKRKLPGF